MDYTVAFIQGIYFFIAGIWPIISIGTFQLVTGPKTDLWLVKTVAIILAVIGAMLISAQVNAEINISIILLAIGSALSLAIAEFVYVAKNTSFLLFIL
jgi:hypothetical protein